MGTTCHLTIRTLHINVNHYVVSKKKSATLNGGWQ